MEQQDNAIPRHIVLFPDGNRRWAKERGLSPLHGHKEGREHFEDFLSWCKKRGVKVVTVYGFSTENWNRSQEEVSYLMDLFETHLGSKETLERFQREGVCVRVIGQKERLRSSLQKVIERVQDTTKHNRAIIFNLAVSYGGRWDITQAVKKIIGDKIPQESITEEVIEKYLSTGELPSPDFVIRTGGEQRLSNFLLWQSAYAELYFSNKYWPDFSEQDFDEALAEYARRSRRFGH